MSKLRQEIAAAINRASAENGSNTPDFILAEYLGDCLAAFDKAVNAREKWYGRQPQAVPYYEAPKPEPKYQCTVCGKIEARGSFSEITGPSIGICCGCFHKRNAIGKVVHYCPDGGHVPTACCGIMPSTIDGQGVLTRDPEMVTCPKFKAPQANAEEQKLECVHCATSYPREDMTVILSPDTGVCAACHQAWLKSFSKP